MAVSRTTGHGRSDRSPRSPLDRFLPLSRYDLVLAAIPLVFALTLTVHLVWAVPLRLAVATGALSSVLLLLDAVYLNPPTDSGSGKRTR